MTAELGELGQLRREVLLAEFVQDGGDVVRDETVALAEGILLEHLDLPTRIVQVDTVKEGALNEGCGDGLEQVAVL